MQSLELPPPFAGIRQSIPKIAIEHPYCETLHNFTTQQEGVSVRFGDKKFVAFDQAAAGSQPLLLSTYGDSKAFISTYNATTTQIEIFDEAGSSAYSPAGAYSGTPPATLYINKYLWFFPNSAIVGPFYYNGSTFGVGGGFTGPSIAFGGDVYNERAYLLDLSNPTTYWYGGSKAKGGACTQVDLSLVHENYSALTSICPVSLSDSNNSQVLQAFVFANGETLFYSGLYPDAPNWGRVAVAKVGQPVNYHSWFSYQGDVLLICDTGLVSLRDLFLKGSEAGASLILSGEAKETWKALMKAARATYNAAGPLGFGSGGHIRGVWDNQNNKIVVSFPFYLDTSGALTIGSFYFVYDTITKAWFTQRSHGLDASKPMVDIARFKNKTITLSSGGTKVMVWEKEGATNFTDRAVDDDADTGFDYDLLSAPVRNGRSYVQKCIGLEPIMKSDLYTATNWSLVSNFGEYSTANQKIPDQGSVLRKSFANVGAEAAYIQYRVSGTTVTDKTIGLQLFGVNFLVNQGAATR